MCRAWRTRGRCGLWSCRRILRAPLGSTRLLGVDGEPIPHLYSAGELGGIGDKIVVRVAYADGTIQDVEVLEQNETPEFGGAALEELPETQALSQRAR